MRLQRLRFERPLGLAAFALIALSAARAAAHPLDAVRELPALSAYFGLGFEHILLGIDHLLFLGGLLLAGGRLRDLLLGATAFTLAHSLTLAAHVLGVLSVDPAWVEPLIALSIAYVGAMNLLGRGASARFSMAFGFGLVHGLGFAGALAEIGVPRERVAFALLSFNAGVEAGQLAVLALLLPLGIYTARRMLRLRAALVSGLNVCLVVAGLCWAGSRVLSATEAAEVAHTERSAAPDRDLVAVRTKAPAAASAQAGSMPRSIYPSQVSADPLARQLCVAFQRLPRERRAACAGRQPGLDLSAECTRLLSTAVGSGALRVDPTEAERCTAALQARYADCAFTAAVSLAPPLECTRLWRGTLAQGARCRSSLECAQGDYCRGLSPLDAGVCAAPEPAGAQCGQGIDPLAAYLAHAEEQHPECSGENECGNGRCRPVRGS